MKHRMVKLLYLNNRSECDSRPYAKRDLWRDKRLMILDAAGVTHHINSWRWDQAPRRIQDKVIDVVTDGDQYFTKHLQDDCSFKFSQVEYQKQKVTNLPNDFDWSKLMTKAVPKVVPENVNWLTSDSAREFMIGI